MVRTLVLVLALLGFSAQSVAANNEVFEQLLKDLIIQKLEEELGVERPDVGPEPRPWYVGHRRLEPGPIRQQLVDEGVPRALVGYCGVGYNGLPRCRALARELHRLSGDCRVAVRIVDLNQRDHIPQHLRWIPIRLPQGYPVRMFTRHDGGLAEYQLFQHYTPNRVQSALGCR